MSPPIQYVNKMRTTADKIMETGIVGLPGIFFAILTLVILIYGYKSFFAWIFILMFGFFSYWLLEKAVQNWRINL